MTPESVLLAVMLFAYPAGALAALGARGAPGRALVAGCGLAGALGGLGLGAVCLGTGRAPAFTALFLPLTGFTLRIDGLSAFFLIVIGVVGAAVTVYGFGYSAAYEGRYSLRLLGAMLNVLLLSLSVQVMADNALTFLMAWEAMSLSAYLMVLTEHDQPGTVRAAHWYIARHARRLRRPRGDVSAPVRGGADHLLRGDAIGVPGSLGSATRPSCWR